MYKVVRQNGRNFTSAVTHGSAAVRYIPGETSYKQNNGPLMAFRDFSCALSFSEKNRVTGALYSIWKVNAEEDSKRDKKVMFFAPYYAKDVRSYWDNRGKVRGGSIEPPYGTVLCKSIHLSTPVCGEMMAYKVVSVCNGVRSSAIMFGDVSVRYVPRQKTKAAYGALMAFDCLPLAIQFKKSLLSPAEVWRSKVTIRWPEPHIIHWPSTSLQDMKRFWGGNRDFSLRPPLKGTVFCEDITLMEKVT